LSIYKDAMLVVDIEATCWEGYTAPAGQENEIIEIGVTALDLSTLALDPAVSLLVVPTASEVSPFCTQLTGLTLEQLRQEGMSFEAACTRLEKEFNARNRLWASWGGWDMRIMRAQCKARGVRYPFSDKHVNLKRLYADVSGSRIGLKAALDARELALEGVHHRGSDDAYNAGRILVSLIQQHSLAILRRYGI
jgi:inhibitor of KinA sporulation pathway (predicted exonuclease)